MQKLIIVSSWDVFELNVKVLNNLSPKIYYELPHHDLRYLWFCILFVHRVKARVGVEMTRLLALNL